MGSSNATKILTLNFLPHSQRRIILEALKCPELWLFRYMGAVIRASRRERHRSEVLDEGPQWARRSNRHCTSRYLIEQPCEVCSYLHFTDSRAVAQKGEVTSTVPAPQCGAEIWTPIWLNTEWFHKSGKDKKVKFTLDLFSHVWTPSNILTLC